jgi:gluconolactonase
MKTNFFNILIIILSINGCKSKAEDNAVHQNTFVQVLDKEMDLLIDSLAVMDTLADGFTWSEGPLWLDEQEKLVFTDVPENTIYSWDSVHGKQIYLKPSGYTIISQNGGTEGANGLILDQKGQLILCQHGNRAVAKMLAPLDAPNDSFGFLASKYKGKKLNSPNDLVQTSNGDIYFTDPPYGLPKQDEDNAKELKYNGIYKLTKDGRITLLDSTLSRPNGIAFSKDEKIMYVANSDEKNANWVKFELDNKKNILKKTEFANKTHLLATQKGLPDGMKISKKGYIFATGPGGVLVFHQDGRHLGTILTGQATANCALDTNEKYLYMTAHQYLMRIALKQ